LAAKLDVTKRRSRSFFVAPVTEAEVLARYDDLSLITIVSAVKVKTPSGHVVADRDPGLVARLPVIVHG
jgi:hypothetical protein